MRSVIEEKTSRIIEVIISSVKPIKLLLGKIIGTSLAGVTQFLAWVILIGVFGMVISAIFGIDAGAMQQQEAMAQAEALNSDGAFLQDVMMELNNLPICESGDHVHTIFRGRLFTLRLFVCRNWSGG